MKFSRTVTVIVLFLILAPARWAGAATAQAVDAAVQRAIDFLYKTQLPDGTWEFPGLLIQRDDPQKAAYTSFATYVLLAAGEKPKDPRLAKAIKYLETANVTGTYALGLHGQVWQYLALTDDVKKTIKKDYQMLSWTMGEGRPEKLRGLYTYAYDNKYAFDESCSQFGVSGMWGLALAGFEVPDSYWETVDKQWREIQCADGGWPYADKPDVSKSTMTGSGLATLLICKDELSWKTVDCKGNQSDAAIERGLKWLADHFDDDMAKSSPYYRQYAMERVGIAGGFKYFGKHDWYKEGCDFILKGQEKDGSWIGWSPSGAPPVADTCFALLFLIRGRAAVMMNKLQYGLADPKGKDASTWNQRPRDCAGVVPWVANQHERHANWQIVNLEASVSDLHDAPILYIAGSDALSFTAEEKAKLKLFVNQGGLILGNADCGSTAFSISFRKLGTELFGYEFRELPKDSPLYTAEMFPLKVWKPAFSIMGLSNGVRELMILVPTADVGRQWAMGRSRSQSSGYQFAADLYDYCTDTQLPLPKGTTYVVDKTDQAAAAKTIRVARVQYTSNWDPEPGGWVQLANIMHNAGQAELQVEPVKLGDGKLDKTYAIAHLTGTGKFSFSDAQRDELRNYITSGGTLIIDATGGNDDFANAVEKELAAIFPDNVKDEIPMLPASSPVYTAGGAALGKVEYRRFAHKTLGQTIEPRVRAIEIGGRDAVFYSREDLSAGLVGEQVDGVLGYQPEFAVAVMRDLIMSAVSVPSAASKPSTRP